MRLLVAACLLSAEAAAQQQEPRSLLPVTPVPSAPVEPDAGEPTTPAEPPDISEFDISVGRLDAVSSDSIGTFDPRRDDFPADLWSGSDGALLLDLIGRIPSAARSPAMQMIARKLMTATAPAPDSLPAAGVFLAARLRALVRLGAFDEASELIDLVPTGGRSDAVLQTAAQLYFWVGEDERACELAREQVSVSSAATWRRALIYCQAASGRPDAASLSLELLREQSGTEDEAFIAAAAVLLGQLDTAPLVIEDGVGFATVVAASAPIQVKDVEELGPAAARALAQHPGSGVEVRLASAERAAAVGALATEELVAAYMLPAFSEDQLRDPPAGAGNAAGPLERALLFQGTRQGQQPGERAALLDVLLAPADGGPGIMMLARAAGVSLRTIAPTGSLIWFAPKVVSALIAGSRYEMAKAWHLLLDQRAVYEDAARSARIRTLPVLAVAQVDFGPDWEPAAAVRWWHNLPDDYDDATRAEVATKVFMALDALGLRVGPDGWALFRDAPRRMRADVPNLGIRYALRDAAHAGRSGETALWALIALGERGPAAADAIALGSAIRSLRAVGLEQAARSLAIEALIEGGW